MMMLMSALYYTNLVKFLIVLAHWNNSPRLDISFHSETSRFRATQSLPYKYQFDLTWRGSSPWSTTFSLCCTLYSFFYIVTYITPLQFNYVIMIKKKILLPTPWTCEASVANRVVRAPVAFFLSSNQDMSWNLCIKCILVNQWMYLCIVNENIV